MNAEDDLRAVPLRVRRAPWRVGRKLGRTIYEQKFIGEADDSDRFLGIMDDARDAELVVELHNAHPDALLVLAPVWQGPERDQAIWSSPGRWMVLADRDSARIEPTLDDGVRSLEPADARMLGLALTSAHRWLAQP